MLIQLPILLALYWVVKKPIIYIMGVGGSDVWRIVSAIEDWGAGNPDAVNQLLSSMKIDSLNVFVEQQFKNFGQYRNSDCQDFCTSIRLL